MLLRELKSIEKTGSGYVLHGDAADVLLIFMTDDVIRVRVSFRRDFKEESYTLVTTAWEDRMDELLKDERTRIIGEQAGSLDNAKLYDASSPWIFPVRRRTESWYLQQAPASWKSGKPPFS